MNKSCFMKDIESCLISKFGDKPNPDQKYIITIQGSSSSGKTTFSKILHNILTNRNINSLLINLDNFYKTADNPLQEDENYDFDNPASLNWGKIFDVIKSLRDDSPTIPMVHRRKDITQKDIQENIENPFPQVIIVEGIYAFNVVNKLKFNLQEFDPNNTSKPIVQELIEGEDVIGEMKVLKIFLPLCKNKFKSIRTARDLKVNKPLDLINSRFETMIWPDTLRWVYSHIESSDIHVVHGNFNTKMINQLLVSLCDYFTNYGDIENESNIPELINTKLFNLNDTNTNELSDLYEKEFNVKCSGECLNRINSTIILTDE